MLHRFSILTCNLTFFSDRTCKGGGHLSVEDASGHVNNTFLEDGFFDYLNKVVYGSFFFQCVAEIENHHLN